MLPFLMERRPPSAAVCDASVYETMAAKSGHICFGKGSQQSATPTTTTVNQNKLPDFAQPYLDQALQQGQALSQNSYTPYPGQQLAGLDPLQTQAAQMAGNLPNVSNPVFGQAQGILSGAAQTGANASNFQAQNWLQPGTAQAYMDPYQQLVTNQTINQINQQAGMQNAQIDSNAVSAGAFGGDRQAVMRGMNNYYTQQAVGQAQAAGGQSAYASGQNQFNADQQARYNAAGLGVQGGQLANAAGQNLGYLGTSMQNAGLQNIQAAQNAGGIMQAQNQSGLNIGYQNFLNQLNFPYQQIGFESGLINGLPLGSVGTTSQYQNPNTVSQMLGLGLGGLGLSQALGKGG